MDRLLVLALVGAVAQLVDGATGMAYGVSSATLMLLLGLAPTAVSATVHLAELPTALLCGLAHWRLGNVRWPLVLAIALPGSAGAWAGATLLASLPATVARPHVAGLLCLLGAYLLLRFSQPVARPTAACCPRPRRWQRLRPAARTLGALLAGLVDAMGGGGWGPLMTSGLLAAGRREVAGVIGSVVFAEFFVAFAASAGLVVAAGAVVPAPWVAALVAGGAAAAPVAAWLVSRLPAPVLGSVVGGLVMLTHAPAVLQAAHAPPAAVTGVCLGLGAVWIGCLRRSRCAVRRPASPAPASGAAGVAGRAAGAVE